MSEQIPIYIVDDQATVRNALSRRLRDEGFRTATFASALEFLEVASALTSGCILLDVDMPEMDGLTLQRHIVERHLRFVTVIMTAYATVRTAVDAIRDGAVEFLQKPFGGAELLGVLATAAATLNSLPAVDPFHRAAEKVKSLSRRERQVLEGLAAGKQGKILAYELGISPRTLEVHRSRVLSKLHVCTIPGMMQVAYDAGLFANLSLAPAA
jgi:two-component system response regulator FixJ